MTALRTYPEAAAELRIPERTLRELVRRHQPPVLVLGRRVLFDDAALDALKEACRRCPSASHAAPAPAA
jgi:excisionase family DNA binding protein